MTHQTPTEGRDYPTLTVITGGRNVACGASTSVKRPVTSADTWPFSCPESVRANLASMAGVRVIQDPSVEYPGLSLPGASSRHQGGSSRLPCGAVNASKEACTMAAAAKPRAHSAREISPFAFLPYVDVTTDGPVDWWAMPETGRYAADRAIGEDMGRRLIELCAAVPGADLSSYAALTAEAMAAKGARSALLGFVGAIGAAAARGAR